MTTNYFLHTYRKLYYTLCYHVVNLKRISYSKRLIKIVWSNKDLKVELIPNELIFCGDVECVVVTNVLKLPIPPTCANRSTGGRKL